MKPGWQSGQAAKPRSKTVDFAPLREFEGNEEIKDFSHG